MQTNKNFLGQLCHYILVYGILLYQWISILQNSQGSYFINHLALFLCIFIPSLIAAIFLTCKQLTSSSKNSNHQPNTISLRFIGLLIFFFTMACFSCIIYLSVIRNQYYGGLSDGNACVKSSWLPIDVMTAQLFFIYLFQVAFPCVLSVRVLASFHAFSAASIIIATGLNQYADYASFIILIVCISSRVLYDQCQIIDHSPNKVSRKDQKPLRQRFNSIHAAMAVRKNLWKGLGNLPMTNLLGSFMVRRAGNQMKIEVESGDDQLFSSDDHHRLLAQEYQHLQAHLLNRVQQMISGVAHDLKSPLSALALGLEEWRNMLKEVRKYRKQPQSSSTLANSSPLRRSSVTFAADVNDELIDHATYYQLPGHFIEDMQNLTSIMEASKKSMTIIINRCVEYLQASNGMTLIPSLTRMNLTNFFEQLQENHKENHREVPIRWEIDDRILLLGQQLGGHGGCHVLTDEMWLEENIQCILLNAMKYNETAMSQGLIVQVSLQEMTQKQEQDHKQDQQQEQPRKAASSSSRKKMQSLLRIRVLDQGLGITPAQRNALFTYDVTTSQKKTGGAGLGLYTLACRVTALYGSFGYEPNYLEEQKADCTSITASTFNEEKSVGSIFWFEIPVTLANRNSMVGYSLASYSNPTSSVNLTDSNRPSPTSLTPHIRNNSCMNSSFHQATKAVAAAPEMTDSRQQDEKKSDEDDETSLLNSLEQATAVTSSPRAVRINRTNSCNSQGKFTSSDEVRPATSTTTSALVPTHAITTLPFSKQLIRINNMKDSSNINQEVGPITATNKVFSIDNNHLNKERAVSNRSMLIQAVDENTVAARSAIQVAVDVATLVGHQVSTVEPKHIDPRRISQPSASASATTGTAAAAAAPDTALDLSPITVLPNLEDDLKRKKQQPPTVVTTTAPSTSLKILVVDDSLPIRKMCTMILQRQGYLVEAAVNGKDALAMMITAMDAAIEGQRPYDLVLLDIQMPIMDGIEAITKYREWEQDYNSHSSNAATAAAVFLPVIAMSACSDITVIEQAMSAGMTCFVPKPFTLQQFQTLLEKLEIVH